MPIATRSVTKSAETKSANTNFVDSTEAARLLGVTRQTLYSYVSRGLLRAQPAQAAQQRGGKGNAYSRADVLRLAARAAGGRKPKAAARRTLDFGLPVLESGLTLIAEGKLWYCGENACDLATHATLEEVASLLWHASPEMPFASSLPALINVSVPGESSLFERAMAAFAAMALQLGPLVLDAALSQQHQRCAALVRIMAAALLGTSVSGQAVHDQCAKAWKLDAAAAQQIRAALVLCADHELNASSFAARCVASTNAQLHAAVLGGLAALSGPRHGAATDAVETLWDQLVHTSADALVADVLTRRNSVPGFGHRLYPAGDPRAAFILANMSAGSDRETAALCEAVRQQCGEQASLDFALVALRRALGLPRGSASIIFALGRTVGWLAHALEQRAQGGLIRPRAVYVGKPVPRAKPGTASGRIVRMKHL